MRVVGGIPQARNAGRWALSGFPRTRASPHLDFGRTLRELLGKRLGLLWNGGAVLLILILFYAQPESLAVFPYTAPFKLRFLTSYLIVSAFSFWFEAMIRRFQRDLFQQNIQHQAALNEVKILRGLLPICCYCHKICNEKEFWRQLEQDIQAHFEAMFSHGICPDCAEKRLPSRTVPPA